MIFALPPKNGEDYSMRIFNSDGSEPEMCGNGIRCLARFIAQRDGADGTAAHRVHTLAGEYCREPVNSHVSSMPRIQPLLSAVSPH